jgi:formylglycine-generating enzyme required for sulfatase activity
MKKILTFCLLVAVFSSCGDYYTGELVGVPGRKKYFEPEPFGMQFIRQGSFNVGPSDQDVPFAQNNFSRTITVEAFWIDETEITNNEYRQYVYWVKDSLIRELLGEILEEEFRYTVDAYGSDMEEDIFGRAYTLNWETRLDMDRLMENEDVRQALDNLYYGVEDRFFNRKDLNVHKLNYRYFWVDLQQAAKRANTYENDFLEDIGDLDQDPGRYPGTIIDPEGNEQAIENRGSFILKDVVNVYPDTLCWIRDFTYSYNEPMANMYFWHPSFDNYPVVGINWKQATAFCIWRTQLLNNALVKDGEYFVQDYRLPTESEWEYAARGDLENSMYPWGGLYTRNRQGCFLANFKPLRGNYASDGATTTASVGMYEPNEYGLYDMAGNVAEWCINAYDESAYFFQHDLNPDYKYNATDADNAVMKRKVIRGGSWKDISYFLQVSTRAYEYQDSSTSYIGFRCVRPYMGNN